MSGKRKKRGSRIGVAISLLLITVPVMSACGRWGKGTEGQFSGKDVSTYDARNTQEATEAVDWAVGKDIKQTADEEI